MAATNNDVTANKVYTHYTNKKIIRYYFNLKKKIKKIHIYNNMTIYINQVKTKYNVTSDDSLRLFSTRFVKDN